MTDIANNSTDGYQGNAFALLTPQALERWRDIVSRAASQGADVSQLVQHFAERAFDNKAQSLNQQGSRRRALANLKATVAREHERAAAALRLTEEKKTTQLKRAYNAVKIEFLPQKIAPPTPAPKKSARAGEPPLSAVSDAPAWTVKPMTPALMTVSQLTNYMQGLEAQMAEAQKEMDALDDVLNRGVQNHERTVADLAAAARELYRIAQEVVRGIEVPKAAAPRVAPAGKPQPVDDEATLAMPSRAPAVMDEDATRTMAAEGPSSSRNAKQPSRLIQDAFTRGPDKARG